MRANSCERSSPSARENYKRIGSELSSQYKATVLSTFWILNGMTIKVPLAAVREIAARPDVLYVEPEQPGDLPPQNEVSVGRSRIVSDPYFNLGLTGRLDRTSRYRYAIHSYAVQCAFTHRGSVLTSVASWERPSPLSEK